MARKWSAAVTLQNVNDKVDELGLKPEDSISALQEALKQEIVNERMDELDAGRKRAAKSSSKKTTDG